MALLFANVAEQYAMKKHEEDDAVKLSSKVSDLFDVIDNPDGTVKEIGDGEPPQKMFMTSVATEYYKKSIEDINNTKIGNKAVRRKNFQQIMKESFFYGANRFGNNFIA